MIASRTLPHTLCQLPEFAKLVKAPLALRNPRVSKARKLGFLKRDRVKDYSLLLKITRFRNSSSLIWLAHPNSGTREKPTRFTKPACKQSAQARFLKAGLRERYDRSPLCELLLNRFPSRRVRKSKRH